ncbi:collagen-binding domain-containing protein [Anaerosacchariphilus polymeriproducens]|nr:collagen-binding domain-containing protein [Anaerosacchariphilus polymeriproducens]
MLNRNSSRMRKIVAMTMAILMTISQSQFFTNAKEQPKQVQSEDNEMENLISEQTGDRNVKEKNESKEQSPDVEQDLEDNLELFNDLKKSVTSSGEGFEKGLGTASNFGIFVNELFQANSEFESNIAVKKLNSLVSPTVAEGKDKAEQISYIRNFSDKKGNVLKENPLSEDYSMKTPYLVIGSVYKVINDNKSYVIDGKRLGFKDNLKVIQEPDDKTFIDLDSEFLYLSKLSTYLADFKTTQTSGIKSNGNSLELESTSEKEDIFNLSGSDFMNGDVKKIKLHTLYKNSTCIINVDLSDYSEFNLNAEAEIMGDNIDVVKDAGRVIWNFYTKKVEDNGEINYQPYKGKLTTTATTGGTFLAPSASIEINKDFYGCIIANSLNVNAKMKKIPFWGKIPSNEKNKKSLTSKVAKVKVKAKATYKGDFDSKNCKGRRIYKVNLSAVADKNKKESVTAGVKNVVIRYYISDYFDLTNECRSKLNDMKEVNCQYDKNKKCQYVEWKNQVIPQKVKWTAILELEAKDKFIGGNDIDTNIKGSGIYVENTQISKFPNLKVNVPVKFQIQSVEGSIGQGELISTELYSKSLNKNVPVQDLMFDSSEIFLGKEPTGELEYLWYQEGVKERATMFLSPVIINSDTSFMLKVIFKPYNTETDTDGKKGLAVSTTQSGNYNVKVSNADADKLEVNNTAVYTGDFNTENKTGQRTYSIKLNAQIQKSKWLPKDIVLIFENNKNIERNTTLKRDYKWTIANDIKEDEWYVYKGNLGYYNVRIGKEEKTGRLRFYDDESNQYFYIDKGVNLYNMPDVNDYISVFDEEKQAVIKFVKTIQEISPESNICILTYSPEKTVLNKTEGFKNVSKDSKQLFSMIENISYGDSSKKELILNEANNVLNDDKVKNNGREKAVILCSELSESPNLEWSEAIKSAELLKNDQHADVNVVNMMNTGSEYSMMLPDTIASLNPTNSARKHYFATNYNLTIDDVLTNISNEAFGSIAGSSIITYLNENFQFTEESKKMFEKDQNINYGFDKNKNQWFLKYEDQIIPTNEKNWSKEFEIEVKEEFHGGSNINAGKSEISYGNQRIKNFPDLFVNVPQK